MQPQHFDSFRSDTGYAVIEQYRDAVGIPGKRVPSEPFLPSSDSDKVIEELKRLRTDASEQNTTHTLKLFQTTLEKIEAYLDQMPLIFKQLFQDLKEEIARLRIWHNTIESDFKSQLVEYALFSTERNRVVASAFERLKDFEREFIQTKEKFYQEIYNCNTHLDVFPVVEFVVKMPLSKVPDHFLPDLMHKINGCIPESVGGYAQVVNIRPGSTIYAVRVPIEAVNTILSALHEGVFDAFKVSELTMIYSLSNVRRFKKGRMQEYADNPQKSIKLILRYALLLLLGYMLIAMIIYMLK
jgi:hypothetical protein